MHARVALCSQLRAELERFWPGPIGLFHKLDSPISLAFLERYPSPADVRGLGEQRLGAFLARQRYSGGQQPTELLSKLRRAPEGRVGEAELAARRALVLALVTAIKPLVEQIKQLTEQIAAALREHPDGEIFVSLFRDPRSVVTAAELLAEIGDCRARYPTRDTLAADAGQAAVAVESGKRKTASFRWGCKSGYAARSAPWPTAPATGTPGRKTATPPPAPAATSTPARYAPSVAPGAGSSGAAGKTAPPTTQPNTAPCNSTARSQPPRRRARCPTSPPPSGCSAPPSPNRRPAGPSAKRLTASRHPLSTRRLTQDVCLVIRERSADGSKEYDDYSGLRMSTAAYRQVRAVHTTRTSGDRIDVYLDVPRSNGSAGDAFRADAISLTPGDSGSTVGPHCP